MIARLCLFAIVAFGVSLATADPIRDLQLQAQRTRFADWGHWGSDVRQYSSSTSHSNRLIPVYTFGMTLESVNGPNSAYRSADRIQELYGRLPDGTLNPEADYFDQTDVYRLQKTAAAAKKKYIFLVVFDGLDWDVTRAAAIYSKCETIYEEGRGTGLFFQDYRGATTDFGYCVTSPYCASAKFDVNAQLVTQPKQGALGGYDPKFGGSAPWKQIDLTYLHGKNRSRPHTYTDSASSATSLTCGVKTFNGAINFDAEGRQVVPIARELQEQGYRVGVVTSVPIPHATPAAAYSNNVSRGDYQDISRDLLGVASAAHRDEPLPGVDVMIGGGWGATIKRDPGQGENFMPGNQYLDSATLQAVDLANGGHYRVAQRTAGKNGRAVLMTAAKQAAENSERLLGFFGVAAGNLPYQTADGQFDPTLASEVSTETVEEPLKLAAPPKGQDKPYTRADIDENPTLADFTSAALQVLGRDEQPFWMMIEAGDVDWALHKNNLDNAIGSVRSGDDAFRVVVEWIEARNAWDDSVIILTSDHGHLFVLKNPQVLINGGQPQP